MTEEYKPDVTDRNSDLQRHETLKLAERLGNPRQC